MRLRILSTLALLLSASALSACTTEPPPAAEGEDVASAEQEILGLPSFIDCTQPRALILSDALRLGSWMVDTVEFNTCMNGGNGTTYRACDDDDVKTVSFGIQSAHSTNDIDITCRDLPANVGGSAFVDDWDNSGTEEINVANAVIDQSISGASRLAGESVLANVMWHEVMHQHGFRHGDSSASTASQQATENRQTCGQTSTWVWNQHSMPYMLGNCLGSTVMTIAESRLAAAGYTSPMLGRLEVLIEAAMARGHVRSGAQLDTSVLAVAWQRKMVASHSGKCLDVANASMSDGAAVNQFTCNSGAQNQRWVTLPLPGSTPAGTPMRNLIMNVNSGKCLDRPNGDVANGTQLQQFGCHGGGAQIFLARSNGQWEALGANGQPSNQCLDIPSFSTTTARLQMSTCKTTNIGNQVFNLQF